jgi:hypothetical protein
VEVADAPVFFQSGHLYVMSICGRGDRIRTTVKTPE